MHIRENPLVSGWSWRRVARELERIVRLYHCGEFYLVGDERGVLRWTGVPHAEIERGSPFNVVPALAVAWPTIAARPAVGRSRSSSSESHPPSGIRCAIPALY